MDVTEAGSVVPLFKMEAGDKATSWNGPGKNDVGRQPALTGSKEILDMGEGSREQGFRLNGCR
jgi:hypothetical protein